MSLGAPPSPPPRALPALALALLERARALVHALPAQPPSLLAALALDRLLLPRLDAAQRSALSHRTVEVDVTDLGLRLRLKLGEHGFTVVAESEPALLTIRAPAQSLLRLARGIDDADRLFFDRRLVMHGDTEFGLVVKNTLDAIGPLWR